ncbi:MAG: S46 family peptidase [Steroidobacteraceae bacterium]
MKSLLIALVAGWLAVSLAAPAADAGEGMWTLDNLPVHLLQQRFGFTPDPAWIERVERGSVRLAGGCSGSFVSAQGLVLTNHHCVVACLEGLSRPGRDLMGGGFYAAARAQELKCPAMEVEQLQTTRDVTGPMNRAMQGTSGAAYSAAEKAQSSKLEEACVAGQAARWRCEVVSLYQGGQYWLYRYRRFQDVRIVFAPSQQTAFFGGNPDNFDFPRYDYDVAFVRAYADGVPAATPQYFHISAHGPSPGELVFTSGNPGSTERNDTVAQLQALRYPQLPDTLEYLDQYRGLLAAFSAEGSEHARIARGALFFTDNSIKALRNELAALADQTLFGRKMSQEAQLRVKVAANAQLARQYGGAWGDIAAVETRFVDMWEPYRFIVGGRGFGGALYDIAFDLVLGAQERALPDTRRVASFRAANLPGLEQQLFSGAPVYPDYEQLQLSFSMSYMRDRMGYDAPLIKALFAHLSPEQRAAQAVAGTKLADVAVRRQLWQGGEAAIQASSDPMIALAREVLPFWLQYYQRYQDEVHAPLLAATTQIARARFALYGSSIAPDATFTERVSYGVVEGWPRHGAEVPAFTHVSGLYERVTGYDPLELAPPWLAARGQLDPHLPMNFVSSNDIVGGNSGSPVLDRRADLVGLIFDGNPPSIGGAFWYDGAQNRAVAVDSAIILAALGTVYHAGALVDELRGAAAH